MYLLYTRYWFRCFKIIVFFLFLQSILLVMKTPTNVEKETDFQFVLLKHMYKTCYPPHPTIECLQTLNTQNAICSIDITWELVRNLDSDYIKDLLIQNLHFNKIPGVICMPVKIWELHFSFKCFFPMSFLSSVSAMISK